MANIQTSSVKAVHDKIFKEEARRAIPEINFYELPTQFLLKYLPKQGSILDMGCGLGKYLNFIKSKVNPDVTGIDLSEIPGQVNDQIICADYTDYLFEKKFDAIYSLTVLEFMPDAEKAIKKINKDLNKGGLLILSVPTAWYNLFNIQRNILYYLSNKERCPYHAFPAGKIRDMLEENGFEILDIRGYMSFLMFDFILLLKAFNKYAFRIDRFIRRAEKMYYKTLDRIIPNTFLRTFGYHLVVCARKK